MPPRQVAADPNYAVQAIDMRVDYGDYTAVHGLNMQVAPGEIYGLIGPNGAGKTSTFRVLATLLEPTYGDIFLFGIDIDEEPERAREILGFMPDLAPVPTDLKVWEFLDLFAATHGFRASDRRTMIAEALEKVQLETKRDVICQTLSRGMKQRLVLAKTLLHRPRVLFLDEPASGMDPLSRGALRDTLRQVASEGTAVLISSHILTELSSVCTSVGIMSQGQLVVSGTIDSLLREIGLGARHLLIRVEGPSGRTEAVLQEWPYVVEVRKEGQDLRVIFSGNETAQVALLARLIEEGCAIRSFAEREIDLETLMLDLQEQSSLRFHEA